MASGVSAEAQGRRDRAQVAGWRAGRSAHGFASFVGVGAGWAERRGVEVVFGGGLDSVNVNAGAAVRRWRVGRVPHWRLGVGSWAVKYHLSTVYVLTVLVLTEPSPDAAVYKQHVDLRLALRAFPGRGGERLVTATARGEFFGGGRLESGKSFHGNIFHMIAPLLRAVDRPATARMTVCSVLRPYRAAVRGQVAGSRCRAQHPAHRSGDTTSRRR